MALRTMYELQSQNEKKMQSMFNFFLSNGQKCKTKLIIFQSKKQQLLVNNT